MAQTENNASVKHGSSSDSTPVPRRTEGAAKPVYEKPRLRRYDQIEQVKPYGPREL